MSDDKRLIIDKYNRPQSCARCRGNMIFIGVGEYRCEKCSYIDYDDYGKVRTYIEEHKGATTAEISAMTGISQHSITNMLREERFEIAEDSRVFLKCKGCGKELRSGIYCPVCEKLAEAAEIRKAAEREREERKKILSGVGISNNEPSDGAKRFSRE